MHPCLSSYALNATEFLSAIKAHSSKRDAFLLSPVGLKIASQALLSLCCTEGSTKAGLDQKRTRASADRPKAVLEGLVAAAALCPSAALMSFLLDVAPSPAMHLIVRFHF